MIEPNWEERERLIAALVTRQETPMRSLLTVVAAVLLTAGLFVAQAAAAPTADQWGTIINLAGRQRMLSQKMAKEYLLVAAKVDEADNRKALSTTLSLFESTLAGLRSGDESLKLVSTESDRINAGLDKVRQKFEELKPLYTAAAAGGTPTAPEITRVASERLALLDQMNKVVTLCEREAKPLLGSNSLATVINLSGRQRMLTQKMTAELLLVHLNIDAEENRTNVRETSSLFDRTLNGLARGDTDLELPATEDAKAQELLGTVATLWTAFRPVITNAATGTKVSIEDVKTVAAANLPLLKSCNDAVVRYEALARESTTASVDAEK